MASSPLRGRRRPSDSMKSTGSVAALLAEARSAAEPERPSLKNPSRPFTPIDSGRHLFGGRDYVASGRPSSHYAASGEAFLDTQPAMASRGSSRSLGATVPRASSSGRPPVAPLSLEGTEFTGVGPAHGGVPTPTSFRSTDNVFSEMDATARHDFMDTFRAPATSIDHSSSAEAVSDEEEEHESPLVQQLVTATAELSPLQTLLAAESDAANAAAIISSIDEGWPQVEQFRAALLARHNTTAGSGASAAALQRASNEALAARRRLLRYGIRRMDGAVPGVLLRLCRLCVALATAPGPLNPSERGAGDNALQGSKVHTSRVLFSTSKDSSLDALFRESGVLGTLLECGIPAAAVTSVGEDITVGPLAVSLITAKSLEMLLYIVGVCKNTSNDAENQRWLIQQGAVSTFTFLIAGAMATLAIHRDTARDTEGASDSDTRISSRQLAQLFVQVTGCLRNLCTSKAHVKPFWVCNAVPTLLSLIQPFKMHSELMLNVVRILSKLSMYEQCRTHITNTPAYISDLVSLLTVHSRDPAVLLRTCFTLGNLTAGNDANRLYLAKQCDAVPSLLRLLNHYVDQFLHAPSEAAAGESKSGAADADAADSSKQPPKEVEDLLVKLVRVLANIAINPECGPRLGVTPGVAVLVNLLCSCDVERNEELVLNVVSAITNLSFYASADADNIRPLTGTQSLSTHTHVETVNFMVLHRLRICQALVPLLLHSNVEAVIESARAFGNFSRDPDIRELLITSRAVEAVILLLDHPNSELVFTACGILMNVVADARGKALFLESPAYPVSKLLSLMHRTWSSDEDVAGIAAKTLYNYLLGWRGSGSTPATPRLTADQCIIVLQTMEELIGSFDEDSDLERSSDSILPMEQLGIARKIRSNVQEMVRTDTVAPDPQASDWEPI